MVGVLCDKFCYEILIRWCIGSQRVVDVVESGREASRPRDTREETIGGGREYLDLSISNGNT